MRIQFLSRFGLPVAAASSLAIGLAMVQGCGGSGSSSSSGLPAGAATLSQAEQGRLIVLQTGCADCHSGDSGRATPASATWLGGYVAGVGSFTLGPATVYAANLTPDAATGLGSISDRKVFNALKFGLDPMDPANPDAAITAAPAGAHYLAPVMPWQSIRNHTDAEIWAIVAYIKHGIKAVSNTPPADTGAGAAVGYWASSVAPVPGAYPLSNEQFTP